MRPPELAPEASVRVHAARSACSVVALVAAAFALAVLMLLVGDWLRYRAADPLDAPALTELRAAFETEPQRDALREELRELDTLARRAHFSSVAFRQRGAKLLLGAVVLLLLALKGRQALVPRRPPRARREPGGSPAASRRLVGLTGAFIAGAALVLGLLVAPRTPPAESSADAGAQWEARLEHWPGFRGPDGLGRAGPGAPPVDWDGLEGRNLRWKAWVPRGSFSSPLVWGDRVFLTGADEEARELYCYDADSGALRWRHDASIPGASATPLPKVTADTGHAASTPTTDGERVYAVFSTGDLVAVDMEGRRTWGRQLGVPDNPYGHAASLVIWRKLLVVQYDQRDRARVMALDSATGETVWENTRDLDVSWSTPALIPGADGEELVLNGNPWVVAYDPATGYERWRVKVMRGELASSPAHGAGLVFVANQFARLAAIVPGEIATVAWEHERDLPEVSSPVVAGDLLFMADGRGAVSCLDARSGALHWRQEFDEGFYASPVVADGRVYLMDRSGVMRIFAASAAYQLLGSPALGEPSDATAAFVADRIYLRGERHLYCIEGASP